MKIGFAPSLSIEVIKHSTVINSMENDLNNFLKDKNYGDDILQLHIGITSVNPLFAKFFKPRLPKYTKGQKSYIKEGVHYEYYNSFEYDIEIDFENFKNANELEAYKMIAKGILASFDVFKTFKNFNQNQFKVDLENYFLSKGLL